MLVTEKGPRKGEVCMLLQSEKSASAPYNTVFASIY